MANPKHVELLRAGKDAWNVTRPESADLSGANLSGWALQRYDLSKANLERCQLSGANLLEAILDEACLNSAILARADARRVRLNGASLRDADLAGADFLDSAGAADWREAKIISTRFVGARLSESNFSDTTILHSDFADSDLSRSKFVHSAIMRTHFQSATLVDVDFDKCVFERVDFSFSTIAAALNLSTVYHRGPSVLDAATLLRNDIDPAFLRGVGVPEVLLEFSSSLSRAAHPIDFYSAFISYSSRDEEFCRRLHGDLQAQGVRCWYAPEDLKIGDPFRDVIEKSIRIYDKLLVVISANSLTSNWVKDEIESAVDRERSAGKTVLFPIRLDDAVMDTSAAAWALNIKRQRHIGDFSRWKEHDEYQKAFERLLRDLKASI